ncbi:MAG TPA: putative glycoside hydrolase, partial [Acidimicrobiia bacterium]|nr:putative glycoside hydrolase [Acidimicrobiia bacterium]
MRKQQVLVVAVVLVTSCTGDIDGAPGTSVAMEQTTSSSLTSPTTAPTTTSTLPATTTTTTTIPLINVSGRVIDEGGDPVARAFVTMEETVAVTGPDGWFSLETTSPTAMSVSKPGWSSTELEWEEGATFYEVSIEPVTIRGLRVSAEAAQSDDAFARLLDLAADSAVNALVFDTKTEDGLVLYDTRLDVAHDIGAVSDFYDPAERLAQAHDQGLYTITRIAAFEDDRRSRAFPDETLVGTWLDPTSESAR